MKFATLMQAEYINFLQPVTPTLQQMAYANLPFIGRFYTNRGSAVACLLEGGTLLTPLHAICDIGKANARGKSPREFYDDLNEMRVYFVKGNIIYKYKIKEILHDGIEVLERAQRQAHNFDYARLIVEGNPCEELGRGLKLDPINHFSVAGGNEPSSILAIMPPTIVLNQNTQSYTSAREIDFTVMPLSSGPYTFPEISSLKTRPGFSGLAILPLQPYALPNQVLYAMHSGRSELGQEGVKISEYLMHVTISQTPSLPWFTPGFGLNNPRLNFVKPWEPLPSISSMFWSPTNTPNLSPHLGLPKNASSPHAVVQFWQNNFLPRNFSYEILKRDPNVTFAEMREFLESLRLAIKQRNKNLVKISNSLNKKVMDSHSKKHMNFNSEVGSKFFNFFEGAQDLNLNALAVVINEIAIEHASRHMGELMYKYLETKNPAWPDTLEKGPPNIWNNFDTRSISKMEEEAAITIERSENFIVDIGFPIGCDKNGTEVSCIFIHGIGADSCHLYPIDTTRKPIAAIIDAGGIINSQNNNYVYK